jgi:hypothetical protein
MAVKKGNKLRAEEVVEALKSLHPDGQWAFIAELRVGTGYGTGREFVVGEGYKKVPNEAEQRLDAWAVNCWPSKGFTCVAYEVKVSRADFLHELKHPQKRELGLRYSNQFYFATPKGLVRPEELPAECGLVEISVDDTTRTTSIIVEAPQREMAEPPLRFTVALARRAGRALKTPGEVKAIEQALHAAESRALEGQSRSWSQETETLELERLVHRLLELDGWYHEERKGFFLPGDPQRFGDSHRGALARELERLKAGVPAITVRLPNPYLLDEHHRSLLRPGRSFYDLIYKLRVRVYQDGVQDPAALATEAAQHFLLWGGDLVKRDPAWVAALVADAVLEDNDYRLSRATAIVAAFDALLDEATTAKDPWCPPPKGAVEALRKAIVPGRSDKPFERRLPGLKQTLAEWRQARG